MTSPSQAERKHKEKKKRAFFGIHEHGEGPQFESGRAHFCLDSNSFLLILLFLISSMKTLIKSDRLIVRSRKITFVAR